jgi:hypothetical protein
VGDLADDAGGRVDRAAGVLAQTLPGASSEVTQDGHAGTDPDLPRGCQSGQLLDGGSQPGRLKANVSKYVAELETRLGVRLLNRSTRTVSLTDAGALLLERSAPLMEVIELTRLEPQQRSRLPSGRLRLTAPQGLGHHELPALLAEFLAQYPDGRLHCRGWGCCERPAASSRSTCKSVRCRPHCKIFPHATSGFTGPTPNVATTARRSRRCWHSWKKSGGGTDAHRSGQPYPGAPCIIRSTAPAALRPTPAQMKGAESFSAAMTA